MHPGGINILSLVATNVVSFKVKKSAQEKLCNHAIGN